MIRTIAISAVVGYAMLGGQPQANAQQLEVCNHTKEPIHVSVGYIISGPKPMMSEGQWKLAACGGCTVVVQASETTDHSNVYLRLEHMNGEQIMMQGGGSGGGRNFCVSNKHAFKIRGDTECESRNFQSKFFQHFAVNIDKEAKRTLTGPGCNNL